MSRHLVVSCVDFLLDKVSIPNSSVDLISCITKRLLYSDCFIMLCWSNSFLRLNNQVTLYFNYFD